MKILGVSDIAEKQIIDIARNNQIEKVILFGSRARGNYKRTSDIDLAVSGGNISAFSLMVDEETSTLLEFDVVNLDKSVEEELLSSIKKEGIIVYEKI